ncbi:uncharacterized protein LOC128989296 [Macrosteles quadrilineatus]|uniref:uncharacterized protein LOC128989296 n=1 Tax=Macrosteles quadrilineatus TaxID=74068 RepID=UPI0023E2E2BC|nr:uncharacterized protein LOC128989296 [Macrosteles quadrilineatus]
MYLSLAIGVFIKVFAVCIGDNLDNNNPDDRGVVFDMDISPPDETMNFDTNWSSNWEGGYQTFEFASENHKKYELKCYVYSVDINGKTQPSSRARIISKSEGVEIDNVQIVDWCKNIDFRNSIQAKSVNDVGKHTLIYVDDSGHRHERQFEITSNKFTTFVKRGPVQDVDGVTPHPGHISNWGQSGTWAVTEFLNDIRKTKTALSTVGDRIKQEIVCLPNECFVKCGMHTHPPTSRESMRVATVVVRSYPVERIRVTTCNTYALDTSIRLKEVKDVRVGNVNRLEIKIVYMNTAGRCVTKQYTVLLQPKHTDGVLELASIKKTLVGSEQDCPTLMRVKAQWTRPFISYSYALTNQATKTALPSGWNEFESVTRQSSRHVSLSQFSSESE